MKQLAPFMFKENAIRVFIGPDGIPLFVASDVAKALGYDQPHKAVLTHCKKSKSLIDIDGMNHTVQQNQQLTEKTKLIPESDIYRLAMRSKLEKAEEFQDWVVEEVLPAIRKTGSYSAPPIPTGLPDFNNPVEAARAWADVKESEQNEIAKNKELQHTISKKDQIITASNEASIKAGEILVREFVKSNDLIDIGEKRFYQWMRDQGYIMEHNEPYQEYVKRGYFTWKPTEERHGGQFRYTIRITPRGKVWLAARYMEYLDLGGDLVPA